MILLVNANKRSLEMMTLRKSGERGTANFGWLKAKHSFSFGNYFDPNFMGFRHLKVINEDRIDPATGFDTHPHRDMEIITYIIDGAIEHKDSEGNVGTISKGEIQRMTAGSGIRHSEHNPLKDRSTHLLQIWIETQQKGLPPSFKQLSIADKLEKEKIALIVSPDGRDGSMDIYQDVSIYAGQLKKGDQLPFTLVKTRHAWIQMVEGDLQVNEQNLQAGDGLAVSDVEELQLTANSDNEFLIFDLK